MNVNRPDNSKSNATAANDTSSLKLDEGATKKGQSVKAMDVPTQTPRSQLRLSGSRLRSRKVINVAVKNSPIALFRAWATKLPTPVQAHAITQLANSLAFSMDGEVAEISFHRGKVTVERGSAEHKACLLMEETGLAERHPDKYGSIVYRLKRPRNSSSLDTRMNLCKTLCQITPVMIKSDARIDWSKMLTSITPSVANNLLLSGIVTIAPNGQHRVHAEQRTTIDRFNALENKMPGLFRNTVPRVVGRLKNVITLLPPENQMLLHERAESLRNKTHRNAGRTLWLLEAADHYQKSHPVLAEEFRDIHSTLSPYFPCETESTDVSDKPPEWSRAQPRLKALGLFNKSLSSKHLENLLSGQNEGLPFDLMEVVQCAKIRLIGKELTDDYRRLKLPVGNHISAEKLAAIEHKKVEETTAQRGTRISNPEETERIKASLLKKQDEYNASFQKIKSLFDSAQNRTEKNQHPYMEDMVQEAMVNNPISTFKLSEWQWEQAYSDYLSDYYQHQRQQPQ